MRGHGGVGSRRWREHLTEPEGLLTVAVAIVFVEFLLAIPDPVQDLEPGARGALATVVGLVPALAYLRQIKMRGRRVEADIRSERERIACDLHDGLVQDLVCITSQGQRLEYGLDPDDPLMVASRHALASVRGVLADLAASTAPTPEAALRVVCDQLGHRFGVDVDVRVEAARAGEPPGRLDLAKRDDLVRAARQAILGAVLRGGVGRAELVLTRAGALRICAAEDLPESVDRDDRAGLLVV